MEAIVIEVKNEADAKFWLNLAKKTGTKARAIDTEKMEDGEELRVYKLTRKNQMIF